ncbi:MAG: molybdopterin cofactor-binding domain-containing protein [Pseudomonadota bacterium]
MPSLGKWTRRGLITTGVLATGGLAIGVALRPGHRAPELARFVTSEEEHLVNVWVKIAPDNTITAIVPHSEMGQGAQTALTQMLADEMGARWDDVTFIEAPAIDEYANWALGKGFILGPADIPEALVPTVDGLFLQVAKTMNLQITGGSMSIRSTGVYGMRVAGAAAREVLVEAAANAWGVPPGEIVAKNSELIHEATRNRSEFAGFAEAAAQIAPSSSPRLKTPEEFTIMGKHVERLDIPAKVDGTAMFGIDAVVPEMKHAAILGAPVFGAVVVSMDTDAAIKQPGVLGIVNLGDAIAVVADGYWQAEQALKAVQVEWSQTGNEHLNSDEIFAKFDADIAAAWESGTTTDDVNTGDVVTAMGAADNLVEARYRVPYLAHSCMEPMNATAKVENGRCEVWLGTQNPLGAKHEVAQALEIEPPRVRIHQHFLGGGFGRRATHDVAIQAARIAKEVGVPVKLIWSREEDVRHDRYRPAVASHFKAALDESGQITAWENVFNEKHEPDEAPTIPYAVANQRIHFADSSTHVPFGAWRSVDHSQHGFFTESFVDELAIAADKDPYEYRRDMLSHKPRHLAVLTKAAVEANWGEVLTEGRGRGISLQESFGSIVAQVVDVTVEKGQVKVDRVVCAIDPGFAVSPDGLTAQMESGIIYGLSAALYGDIQIQNGAVVQGNFHDYRSVRLNEAPVIETHIINSHAPWGGAGEPGTPGIAPALANAVYQATGTRVRQLPISNYDFTYRVVEPEEVI